MGQADWTIEDVLELRHLEDAQLSQDGKYVAYVIRDAYREELRVRSSHIYVADITTGESKQFTNGPGADACPRWSPDSNKLAFISDREEEARFDLFTIDVHGGEAIKLTDLEGSVLDLRWSPDGRYIGLLLEGIKTPDEDLPIVFEEKDQVTRIWKVDSSGGDAEPLSPEGLHVWEFGWLEDSSALVAVCSRYPYEWSWYESFLALIDASSSEYKVLYSPDKQIASPSPSPDSRYVAFIKGSFSDRGSVGGEVCVVDLRDGMCRSLTKDYPGSFCSVHWLDSSHLLAIGYESGNACLLSLSLDGNKRRLWLEESMVSHRWCARFTLDKTKRLGVMIKESHSSPPDVWSFGLSDSDISEWEKITEVFPDLRAKYNGEPKTIVWKSSDGLDIQGIFLQPGSFSGEKPPLVTIVHGGPSSMYHHSFLGSYFLAPVLVSNGYAVFLPNPRGSYGWGTAFAEANLGDMGGMDKEDIISGVEYLLELGYADPSRLAIAGWSYGGFMTAWMITQTDIFKAAVMGAGIANWRSFHGVTNIPTWDKLYYRDDPYRLGGRFDKFSPINWVGSVKTPTLILHGEKDACVPVGQAYEMYRALRDHQVPAKLVVYPGQGHVIDKKSYVQDMYERILDWFGEHLKV